MKKKYKFIMVGSALSNKGGMTSVIQSYKEYGLLEQGIYCATSQDGSNWLKISDFVCFLMRFCWLLFYHRECHIVHVHVSQRGSFIRKSLVYYLAKLFKKKVIFHMHGSEFILFYQRCPAWGKKFILSVLEGVDCLIALSEKRKQELETIIKVKHSSIRVIYNPCRLQPYPNRRHGKESLVILFMGRFGQRKGIYDLLQAARQVSSPHLQFVLHGDGEVEKVRQVVQEQQLHNKVQVYGWVTATEKHQTFKNADILILPSYNEGLPMSILEALGYGMPVIATPVGGVAEAVIDGQNGFLVNPGDINALSDCIVRFLKSDQLCDKMGQNSYKTAKEKFEISKIVTQLENLYNDLEGGCHVLSEECKT